FRSHSFSFYSTSKLLTGSFLFSLSSLSPSFPVTCSQKSLQQSAPQQTLHLQRECERERERGREGERERERETKALFTPDPVKSTGESHTTANTNPHTHHTTTPTNH